MRIQNCRLCHSQEIEKVVDLGHHPLADTFHQEEHLLQPETWFPLHLGLCRSCGHVFTLYLVSAEDRYQKNDYSYDSSNSKVSIEHFREFAESVIREAKLPAGAFVADIGSNVGTLLEHFRERGRCRVLGIEPSRNITEIAIKNGIPTINEFFIPRITSEILRQGPLDALVSANVLNHADDLGRLLETAKSVLKPDGVFVFEVPYLAELVKRTAFDTIYHEHVHYHGIRPLSLCLEKHGFSISQVELLEYMCGSIRVFARIGGTHSDQVRELIKDEEAFGLYEPATFRAFMGRVRKVKDSVNAYLWNVRKDGGKIIGIGAATKGNTFLNYCRLDSDVISYVTDSSSLKINKWTPGSHIPIVADEDIDSEVTHAMILPWNIADFLKRKLSHLKVEFYVPQVEVLTSQRPVTDRGSKWKS